MKIMFEYFGQAQICSSASQAVEFINALYCHNNPRCAKLVVNDKTRELLEDLFSREWTNEPDIDRRTGLPDYIPVGGEYPYRILVVKTEGIFFSRNVYYDGFQIRTTGCSNTYINGYRPLADTVEGHRAEVLRIREEKKARQRKERDERLIKRHAELDEIRKGWYSVSLTYERMRYPRMNMVESTFSGKCIAESGMDAYRKLIAEIEKDGEASFGAVYPDAISDNYSFVYLGVKTDDGYTFKEWEDEQ